MATYSFYRNQVSGYTDVLETVKTVEKIAASTVHFLKVKVAHLNDYTVELETVLARLSLYYYKKNHPLLQKGKSNKKMLIIIMGDRGLVGGLWHTLTNAYVNKKGTYHGIVIVGKRGENFLKEEHLSIVQTFDNPIDTAVEEKTKKLSKYAFDMFGNGSFGAIDILYPRFVSLGQQEPFFMSLLPFTFLHDSKHANPHQSLGFPIFDPSARDIFDRLLQKYIGVYLHKILLEAKLSELSARTAATEHASVKTRELLKKLDLSFRKERHRRVTEHQLENFITHKAL